MQTPPSLPLTQGDKVSISPGLEHWLHFHKSSIVFTSYDSGAVYFLGELDGKVSVNFVNIGRAMGVCRDIANTLYVAASNRIFTFENDIPQGETSNGFDAVYVPRMVHFIGDVDMHEIAGTKNGLAFVNTRYSCLANLSMHHSFDPLWKPDFITKLAPEDRCHLNGVGVVDGISRLVSLIGRSDMLGGWRAHRENGGMIIDLQTGTTINNLSMPHSPRMYNGFVYYLDSGRGFLMRGEHEKICFLPGFARGLALHDGFAVVTVSLPRDGIFKGLELQEGIVSRGGEAWCGVLIIDIEPGEIVHWFRLEGPTRELFDCTVLPGVRCPSAFSPNDPVLASRITYGRGTLK